MLLFRHQIMRRCAVAALILALPALGFFVFEHLARRPSAADVAALVETRQIETVPEKPRSAHVPILVYHNIRPPSPTRTLSEKDRQYEVTPEQFDAEMALLSKEDYVVVSFDDLTRALRGDLALGEKSVIITLDDGRDSQYTYALPILKKYGYKATFFIFTNAIGRRGYLTWDQLKELRDAGMAIEAHTRLHPFLTRIVDDVTLRDEIIGSKKSIEEQLGIVVHYFAYPFGMYDNRVANEVKDAGFLAARGLRHAANVGPNDLFTLGGFIATGDLGYFRNAILGSKR